MSKNGWNRPLRVIEAYFAEYNKATERYAWKVQGKDILAKMNRAPRSAKPKILHSTY